MDEKEYMKRVAEIDIDRRGPLPPYDDPTTITRRDRFAIAALQVLYVLGSTDYDFLASSAYELADAMEAARNKEGGE